MSDNLGKETQTADHSRSDADIDPANPVWRSIFTDPALSRPPTAGSPGNIPTGNDLHLDIGWERFEQLLLFVAQGVVGLNQVRFRRYGLSGQAQHGIDLAGRRPDKEYTVIQCKHHDTFSSKDLRIAVENFANGRRPFGARHLIVAISTIARTTQIEDELAALQNEHQDLHLDLWGAEQINDILRGRADIVSRFWTRETANTFCTGAPLAGVAAAPPNWTRVAEQILLSPLGVDDLDEMLVHADALRTGDPASAAAKYGQLAERLTAEGFTGHANLLRHKQLDALTGAGELEAAATLAAQLAATALHEADMHQAQGLSQRLETLARSLAAKARPNDLEPGMSETSAAQHAALIGAAILAAQHPLGDKSALTAALREQWPRFSSPTYRPILVLLLAELTVADATFTPSENCVAAESGSDMPIGTPSTTMRIDEMDDLISSALAQLNDVPAASIERDVAIRLRLVRAGYNADERTNLLKMARQVRLPRAHAALVLANQARRDALEGSPEEAIEHWRQAVEHAILEGRTDDAAGWLYAIRAVNARYGPWTSRIDEEHLLAQALPKTGSGRLIRRARNPR